MSTNEPKNGSDIDMTAKDFDLKELMNEDVPVFDEESLSKKRRSSINASNSARDLLSILVAWIWVIFAGFGARIHKAIAEKKAKSNTNKLKQNQQPLKGKSDER